MAESRRLRGPFGTSQRPLAGGVVMAGRHAALGATRRGELIVTWHDLCPCGRRDPRSLSFDELARDARSCRRVQRAAARLRLVTDRRLERDPTPGWVVDLAGEQGEPILGAGWVEEAIARLDGEARKHCPCRCHGKKTQRELDYEARRGRNLRRAAARLQVVLDERLARHTPESFLVLAAEDDE
jgi:hypothetical protein